MKTTTKSDARTRTDHSPPRLLGLCGFFYGRGRCDGGRQVGAVMLTTLHRAHLVLLSRPPFYAQPDSERVLKSLSRSHNDRKSSDWGFLTHQPVSRCRLPRLSGRWGTRTVDYLNQGSQILRGSQPQMPVRHPVYRKTLETHNAVSGRACVTPRIQGLNSW